MDNLPLILPVCSCMHSMHCQSSEFLSPRTKKKGLRLKESSDAISNTRSEQSGNQTVTVVLFQ